jgi:plasmid stabilization system protein ParE
MSGFVFHPDVLDDLNEIVDFIAADSPAAAERVIEDIYKAIGALVSFPQNGPPAFSSDLATYSLSSRPRPLNCLRTRSESDCHTGYP